MNLTRLLTCHTVLALFLSTAPAQVPNGMPDGWYAVSAHKELAGSFAGDGGIYLAHPRRPGSMLCVTGLPVALTAASYTGLDALGANCILIHPSGDLLLGHIALGQSPLDLYRIQLNGLAATVVATVNVGVAGAGRGGIHQMAWVSPDMVLVSGGNVSGPMGPAGSVQVATVDLSTGAVTRLPLGPVPGNGNALAYDQASGQVYLGVYAGNPAASTVYRFPLANPGASVAIAAFSGRINNLAVEASGSVIAALNVPTASGLPVLYRVAPSGYAVVPLLPTVATGWDVVPAVAVEPSTGELAFCGIQVRGNPATGGVHWYAQATGAVTTLGNTLQCGAPRGPLSGIAAAPAPAPYGSPSACPSSTPDFTWSTAPHPAKLPLTGNLGFFVDADWPVATAPAVSFWIAGFAPASWQPLPCLQVLVSPVGLVSGAMTLDAASRRSVLNLPLPATLPQTCCLYLQSVHLTASGAIAASDGLRVPIL